MVMLSSEQPGFVNKLCTFFNIYNWNLHYHNNTLLQLEPTIFNSARIFPNNKPKLIAESTRKYMLMVFCVSRRE